LRKPNPTAVRVAISDAMTSERMTIYRLNPVLAQNDKIVSYNW
jgi:hypothetical protein